MRKLFLVLLVLGVSTLLAAPAWAVCVTDLTTSTVLFYDGFEGLGSNVSHAAYADMSGDYDPTGGSPGSWSLGEPTVAEVQVADYTPPGPATGSNYLRVVDGGYVMAMFTTPNVENEVIQFSQMVNMPEFSSGHVTVYDIEGAGWCTKFALDAFPDGSVQFYGGAPFNNQYVDTGVDWTPGVWQDWTVTYVQGQASATLKIDGVGDADNVFVIYPNYPDYSCAWNYMAPNGKVLNLDAKVPEPSSIVLMVMGALALVAIRRVR